MYNFIESLFVYLVASVKPSLRSVANLQRYLGYKKICRSESQVIIELNDEVHDVSTLSDVFMYKDFLICIHVYTVSENLSRL